MLGLTSKCNIRRALGDTLHRALGLTLSLAVDEVILDELASDELLLELSSELTNLPCGQPSERKNTTPRSPVLASIKCLLCGDLDISTTDPTSLFATTIWSVDGTVTSSTGIGGFGDLLKLLFRLTRVVLGQISGVEVENS